MDCRNLKHSIKLTDQPGNLIPLDRGGVPDLSVSGDNFDLVEVDPHDPTTTSEPDVGRLSFESPSYCIFFGFF